MLLHAYCTCYTCYTYLVDEVWRSRLKEQAKLAAVVRHVVLMCHDNGKASLMCISQLLR